MKVQVTRDAEERETRARVAYSDFRRAEIDKLFAGLPRDEQAAIEALARSNVAPAGHSVGFMADTLFKLKRAQITAERHGDRIPLFEHWAAAHAPGR